MDQTKVMLEYLGFVLDTLERKPEEVESTKTINWTPPLYRNESQYVESVCKMTRRVINMLTDPQPCSKEPNGTNLS